MNIAQRLMRLCEMGSERESAKNKIRSYDVAIIENLAKIFLFRRSSTWISELAENFDRIADVNVWGKGGKNAFSEKQLFILIYDEGLDYSAVELKRHPLHRMMIRFLKSPKYSTEFSNFRDSGDILESEFYEYLAEIKDLCRDICKALVTGATKEEFIVAIKFRFAPLLTKEYDRN